MGMDVTGGGGEAVGGRVGLRDTHLVQLCQPARVLRSLVASTVILKKAFGHYLKTLSLLTLSICNCQRQDEGSIGF